MGITSTPPPAMHKAVGEYANALGPNGPDSEQTRAVREKHAGLEGFAEYADALDRVKTHLGGKGMKGRGS